MGARTYIAIAITTVWAISYVGSLVSDDYTGFSVSTPVMLIVATYLLGSDIARRRNGNDRNR